ncbi:GNAT family N-acetyltransferase [bacterium]|nr:GNAT family N-acetyltransferase [bacterium]
MGNSQIDKTIRIRKADPSDHSEIISVMQYWWDGRDLTAMLPRLFLIHFNDTSLVIEKDAEFIGFLVGFLSQSRKDEAYIHFVGIHPNHRKRGLGGALYERFFRFCREQGRMIIRSCTSPVNRGSIAFHTRMGFQIESGDSQVDGIPVTVDYNGPNDDKVLFTKYL